MRTKFTLLLLFFAFPAQVMLAQDAAVPKTGHLNLESCRSKWEYGAEFLLGTTWARHINTANINVSFWKKYFKKATVLVHIGATLSHSSGCVRLGDIRNQVFYMQTLDCGAFGLGPLLQLQYIVIRSGNFSIEGEANGTFLFYNKTFPFGQNRSGFMFRAGPNVCWDLDENTTLKASYRWMNTSPFFKREGNFGFYEGQGMTVTVAKYIR